MRPARPEELLALQANAQIEEQERKVRAMRGVFLQALPMARDGGLSATELSDAWFIDRSIITRTTDEFHRERKCQR
jgi:hypothetical protein